jgi:ABC-type branched-subunit amino acid transport system ATPase component
MNPERESGTGEKHILSCRKLTKAFGGVHALKGLDMDIERGRIHGLIGPNGSGKTTFFNVVSGLLPATAGEVFLEGEPITASPPHAITRLGIARTFQKAHLIPTLTCVENVMAGAFCRTRLDVGRTFCRAPFTRSRQEEDIRARAEDLLRFVGLESSAKRWAEDLVWVETQMLQIARALALDPRLLLLDEPSAGMGEGESGRVMEIIQKICAMGITVILVAHDVKLVRKVSDRVTAINFGEKISEGTAHEVLNDPKVAEAYLGKK